LTALRLVWRSGDAGLALGLALVAQGATNPRGEMDWMGTLLVQTREVRHEIHATSQALNSAKMAAYSLHSQIEAIAQSTDMGTQQLQQELTLTNAIKMLLEERGLVAPGASILERIAAAEAESQASVTAPELQMAAGHNVPSTGALLSNCVQGVILNMPMTASQVVMPGVEVSSPDPLLPVASRAAAVAKPAGSGELLKSDFDAVAALAAIKPHPAEEESGTLAAVPAAKPEPPRQGVNPEPHAGAPAAASQTTRHLPPKVAMKLKHAAASAGEASASGSDRVARSDQPIDDAAQTHTTASD
jgi:hypothetical protein